MTRHRGSRIGLVAVLSSLMLMPLPARAAEETDTRPVTLAAGSDYTPFTDRGRPDGGLVTALVQEAFTLAGQETALRWMPWRRAYEMVRTAHADATFPYVHNAERAQQMLYSPPVITVREYLWYPRSDAPPITTLAQVHGDTLCTPDGWAVPEVLATLVAEGTLKEEKPRERSSCVTMILQGRADFMVGDPFSMHVLLRREGARDRFLQAPMVLNRNTLHLIIGRENPRAEALMAAFTRGLQALRDSGRYDTLLDRDTLPELSTKPTAPKDQ